MNGIHTVLRVERGRATDAEVAALAAVLCALRAAPDGGADGGADAERAPGVPSWRPELAPAAYRSPYCWR